MQQEAYMGIYEDRNDPVDVMFCDDMLRVTTRDGRIIYVPLSWFPWFADATPEQLQDYEIMGSMIHWNHWDEGISMEVILLGRQGT